MHGASPAARDKASQRWSNLQVFDRAVRDRARQLRDEYVAREALRLWISDQIGRPVPLRGLGFVGDKFEAEIAAGGPPTDEDLAPFAAAVAASLPMSVVVDQVTRDLAVIRAEVLG